MSDQDSMAATARLYRDRLRDAAARAEQWAHGLRLAADLLDPAGPEHLDLAMRPALSALGAISQTYEQALDHTLLLTEYVHIPQREIADRLGVSQPTVGRRIKKLQDAKPMSGDFDRGLS